MVRLARLHLLYLHRVVALRKWQAFCACALQWQSGCPSSLAYGGGTQESDAYHGGVS